MARQYCGTLGKVENCQVGVFAGYASRQGYALVDKRLFVPEAWFSEAYAARRTTCNVPTELTFQSKPQLAAAMLQAIAHEGFLPFKYVVADCLYGKSPDFLDAVDACIGVTTFVAIPADTRCWLQRPRTEDKTYIYKGDVRAKQVVVAPHTAHALWRLWRPACLRRAGISAPCQKGRKGRLHTRLPANASRCARMACPIAPSGW